MFGSHRTADSPPVLTPDECDRLIRLTAPGGAPDELLDKLHTTKAWHNRYREPLRILASLLIAADQSDANAGHCCFTGCNLCPTCGTCLENGFGHSVNHMRYTGGSVLFDGPTVAVIEPVEAT